jgi:hypothetical protein
MKRIISIILPALVFIFFLQESCEKNSSSEDNPKNFDLDIEEVKITPQKPTVEDSLYLMINLTSPQQPLKKIKSRIKQAENKVLVDVFYHMGLANSTGYYEDSLFLGKFDKGIYSLELTVYQSLFSDSCTYENYIKRSLEFNISN